MFREPRRGFGGRDFAPERSFGRPRREHGGPPIGASVKWFNAQKGFGFVLLDQGAGEAFLHVSAVEASGHDPALLEPGAKLRVRVTEGAKGPQIGELLEVTPPAAPLSRPKHSWRAAEVAEPSGPSTRMTGRVKWYNPEKRFGFIAVDGGRKDVFVHAAVLARSGIGDLSEGQRVDMEVAERSKGLEALAVTIAE